MKNIAFNSLAFPIYCIERSAKQYYTFAILNLSVFCDKVDLATERER